MSSEIVARSEWLGLNNACTSSSPVVGDVLLRFSHSVIALRSYVWPSAHITGSFIGRREIGQ